MSTRWQNRLSKAKFRPKARDRLVRPGFDALDERVLLSVSANLVNGQLLVTNTSDADVVALDHTGSTTFVNGTPFADGGITNGILIKGDMDTVNILATVKPVTVDGQFDLEFVNLGKNGSTQGILAPLNLSNFL